MHGSGAVLVCWSGAPTGVADWCAKTKYCYRIPQLLSTSALELEAPDALGYPSCHDMLSCHDMIPSHDMMTCHDMMKCHEMITSHDMNFTDDGVP